MARDAWHSLFHTNVDHWELAQVEAQVAAVQREADWNLEDQGKLRAENASLRTALARHDLPDVL